MALLTFLASLFGCAAKEEPMILDGPGMMYIDREHRTEYANCLPFDNFSGNPYMAICYLGSGSDGEANKENVIGKIFGNLDSERLQKIQTYELDGADWYLVIPRYWDPVDLKNGEEMLLQATGYGDPFVVRCGEKITVSLFNCTYIEYVLSTDEQGNLANTGENVWDITNIDEILNQ